jgi:hypothetical protein
MLTKGSFFRAAGFKYPKPITDEDFVDICKNYGIPSSERRWFDALVSELADWMRADREQPSRGGDREHIKKAREYVMKAAARINRLSPVGRSALPILMYDCPDVHHGIRRPMRRPIRSMSPRYLERAMADALKEVERGFTQALQALDCQPGTRGGRKRNVYRDYFIIYLAVQWAGLGKKILIGPKSDFVAFCESVAVAIGWPTDGISEAVRLRNFSDVERTRAMSLAYRLRRRRNSS